MNRNPNQSGEKPQGSAINVWVDDRRVEIAVSPELKAHFDDQFSGFGQKQRQRRNTLLNLMSAAFKAQK